MNKRIRKMKTAMEVMAFTIWVLLAIMFGHMVKTDREFLFGLMGTGVGAIFACVLSVIDKIKEEDVNK
jgi:hypothetical protein